MHNLRHTDQRQIGLFKRFTRFDICIALNEIATLSEYFNREMILADECLIKGDESGAAVYSHIAKVIDAALKELEEPEE